MTRALVLVLVAGCRSILGIEDLAGDPIADNDEDGDGVYDPEDNCPTVSNFDQADAFDGDGVGSACDFDQGAPNRIIYYSPLLDDRGIAAPLQLRDGFALVDGAPITLLEQFKPARVEAVVALNSLSVDDNVGVEVEVGGQLWSCFVIVKATSCGGITCAQIRVPNQNPKSGSFLTDGDPIARVTLDTRADGSATCIGQTRAFSANADSNGPAISTGVVRFRASNAQLKSLLVYE